MSIGEVLHKRGPEFVFTLDPKGEVTLQLSEELCAHDLGILFNFALSGTVTRLSRFSLTSVLHSLRCQHFYQHARNGE